MKTGMRVVAVTAVALVMVFGAWGIVLVQANGALPGSIASIRALGSSLLHRDSTKAASRHPDDHHATAQPGTASSSAVEDHAAQHPDDVDAVRSGTPEPGDDNGLPTEPVEAPDVHHEATGTVTAISAGAVTIDGSVYQLPVDAEGLTNLTVGAIVKVELVTNPDGTVSVQEVKLAGLGGDLPGNGQTSDDSPVQHESGGGSGSGGGHHGGGHDGSGG